MDWWRSAVERRKRVEARLGYALRDQAWKYLRQLYDKTPRDAVEAEELIEYLAEKARDAFTLAALQGIATTPREPAPSFLPTRQRNNDRLVALSRVLAALAGRDKTVLRFRQQVLGGRLLAPEETEHWITGQAACDGEPTVWLSLPLPPGVHPKPGETLSLTVPLERYRVDVPILSYVVPGDRWVRRKPIAIDGVLGQLHQLSKSLSRRYGWHEAAATTFVLTGLVPRITAMQSSVYAHVAYPALQRITLQLDPVLTPAEVAVAYRTLRTRIVGKQQIRTQSPKHLALAVFAVEYPDGSLRERMAEWNRRYPKWRYNQVTNFGRDLRTALRRLLGTPTKHWETFFGKP